MVKWTLFHGNVIKSQCWTICDNVVCEQVEIWQEFSPEESQLVFRVTWHINFPFIFAADVNERRSSVISSSICEVKTDSACVSCPRILIFGTSLRDYIFVRYSHCRYVSASRYAVPYQNERKMNLWKTASFELIRKSKLMIYIKQSSKKKRKYELFEKNYSRTCRYTLSIQITFIASDFKTEVWKRWFLN